MGWVALITFRLIYALAPVLWRRETMYFWKAVEWHFWSALSGTVIYVFAVCNSGMLRGLIWRTYTESGPLKYSVTDTLVAMHPCFIARAFGGLLFLIGVCIGALERRDDDPPGAVQHARAWLSNPVRNQRVGRPGGGVIR